MIDLCQWRARIGSWNSSHWPQSSDYKFTLLYQGKNQTNRSGEINRANKTPRLVLSIFCLIILLFISGDVELNPGPTLTDKPTKDELVEFLSSSKFTASTWEQFVCYFPDMTQDIIIEIKQRKTKEADAMSDIAQYCLDNTDITWRKVIDALLDANEVIVARNVLDKHSGTSSSKNVYQTVKQILQSHFSKLVAITETCLIEVANELYSKNLINREVRRLPTFDKIEVEFSAMLSLYMEDAKKTEELCSLFLDCLSTVGGPAQEEAFALARDWENEVLKNHKVVLSLTKVATEFIPKKVKLGSNDNLAIELQNLHKKYAKLIADITTHYASSEKHKAIVIARWAESYFDIYDLAQDGVTADKIFQQMRPHYNFIDITAINDLVDVYPIDDSALQTRLDEYNDNLVKFLDSTKQNDAIQTIEETIIEESTKVNPKIIVGLSGKWKDKTIGHLRILINYLFDEEAKYVTITRFLRGSVYIQFLVFSSRLVQPLVTKLSLKFHFLSFLGIFRLIIDKQTIIDKEEDVNFTFEESLLQSIKSIESNQEYHRLSLLLIKLDIHLNDQNANGKTPLILASEGGHIEIFKSLLQNDADPFVQKASGLGEGSGLGEESGLGKGYIGLNHLACFALSQHVYRSIGVRIMPQEDTSIQDMLKTAVQYKRVNGLLYKPFVDIIESKLKEKFEWLKYCFHVLNGIFKDAATNNLVNKAMVTEAKQNFQSYIEEDAICENVHQFLQLLRPHYSCLNIDLLTIARTITEPIKKQIEDYNTDLKKFKDTTSLLELAMMTKGMQRPDGVDDGCCTIVVKLRRIVWSSKTITELNRIENSYISSFLTLLEIQCNEFVFTCTYVVPRSQTAALMKKISETIYLLSKSCVSDIGFYDKARSVQIILSQDESTMPHLLI
uniref:Uncharacterized protein n=1 Tax=Amphimedon queenslandica TaxID=400682 RepID=A0A1X7T1L7_AMPQE